MNHNTDELISRIISLELEITYEILKGHKPFNGDYLEIKRQEVNMLRCIVFGYKSNFCKNK
jgi:hypothetical protein